MSRESDRTIKSLKADVGRDLNRWVDTLMNNLRSTTPIRTGQARSGWHKQFDKSKVGRAEEFKIARNDVDYIEQLDKGSSRQSPRGIVEQAINKTRK